MQSIVKKERVHFAGEAAPAAGGERHKIREAARGAKSVRLLRIDGAARALEVTCSCGERTVVELDYETAPERGEVTR